MQQASKIEEALAASTRILGLDSLLEKQTEAVVAFVSGHDTLCLSQLDMGSL